MTALFSPYGNSQVVDANGDPAMGYTITTYAAGSSTLLASYTDYAGLSANDNPVTLNSAGRNPNGQFWLASGLAYKFVLKDAQGVTVQTVDNVTGTNDPATLSTTDQWVTFSGTPTYISATSFSVSGDQTGTLHVLRRLKTTNTGGTVHLRISASSYDSGTGLTTVTVVNDSGSLDSGLSSVSYGLLSATNPSIPETSVGKTLRTSASVAAVQTALATTGTVLQELVFTDAGTTTTASSLANVTASAKSITPKSTSSTIVVTCTFQGQILAAGSGNNSTGAFRLYNNTAGADIGTSENILGVVSVAGANVQTNSPCTVTATVANSALTAVAFVLRARYAAASTTVGATNQIWTIREIQN